MLDLTLIQKNDYEVKWVDGEVLTIPAPSRNLYTKLTSFVGKEEYINDIDMIYSLCQTIVDTNNQKKEVDAGVLSIDTCVIFLGDYIQHFSDQINDVVFQQTQRTVKTA